MKRRNFLLTSATLGGATLMGASSLYSSYDSFEQERGFSITSLYKCELRNGKRIFDINLQHGEMVFLRGFKTKTLGINAPFLDPTLH